mmetsp:Transcript_38921/g.124917  ORF Transcript_38921/g.124917 Transcript_38921/m.124917 type:complete len:208 (-) Transcript_38921:1758-2381(-)
MPCWARADSSQLAPIASESRRPAPGARGSAAMRRRRRPSARRRGPGRRRCGGTSCVGPSRPHARGGGGSGGFCDDCCDVARRTWCRPTPSHARARWHCGHRRRRTHRARSRTAAGAGPRGGRRSSHPLGRRVRHGRRGCQSRYVAGPSRHRSRWGSRVCRPIAHRGPRHGGGRRRLRRRGRGRERQLRRCGRGARCRGAATGGAGGA